MLCSYNTYLMLFPAILIAVRMSSIQFGSFMAWSLLGHEHSWWVGYPVIGSLLILFGTLVATFPRDLLDVVMDKTVAIILENVRGNSSQDLVEDLTETPEKPETGKHLFLKTSPTTFHQSDFEIL